ncbi:MFS-type transporter SLC18B1-like isoform X1 [Littorina saxatilis]|uniref:MFS-type transporter SLC18B1-like isoform X1 n=1 Tax=Littorina saxatilis TaxID=31220 RepID=UPI0038B46822
MVAENERHPVHHTDARTDGSPAWNGRANTGEDDKSSDYTTVQESPDEKGDGTKKSFSFSAMSSRKKATFLQLAFANFAACACFSLLAPFFPHEAAEKDMPASLIGLVFSCFELCMFTTSPIFGNYIAIIGPKSAFVSGQFLSGGCSILFGLLYMSPPGVPFIALCFAVRIVQALGASAFVTASFALIANEFPENVGTAFGALETFTGLGYVVGPLLGGVLYEVGGFGTPFFVMGALLILCSAMNHFLLKTDDVGGVPRKRRGSMLRLLKSPLILVVCVCVVMNYYTFGFLSASLAIHLEQFNLSAAVVGALFMIMAAMYCIFSPFIGWLSDRTGIVYPYLIIGCIFNAASLLIVGPTPLLPFAHPELWLVVISLFMFGPAVGAAVIPAVKLLYAGARRLGFHDGLDLDGLVSGLLTSLIHFGTFLGPTIGSPVMQEFGFEWSASLNAAFCLFAASLLIVYIIVEKTCLHYDDNKKTSDVKTETTFVIDAPNGNNFTTDTSPLPQNEKAEQEF